MLLKVINTDNRDSCTTTLTLEDSVGNRYEVDVDPGKLFRNMCENNYEDLDESNHVLVDGDIASWIEYLARCISIRRYL